MIEAGKYRHVFFDLDETLWDFRRNSMETLRDLLATHEFQKRGIPPEPFIQRYHHHNEQYWTLYRQGTISRQELRTARWTTTLKEFNVHDDEFANHLSKEYLRILPTKKNLFSETIELLQYLKPKYKLHIITNGFEEVQLRKIETSGLASYFTHIITSERAGSQKPRREIFLYAFDITGASVRESIFIGDSLEADITGAKGVGMDHVLFNPERMPHADEVMLEIHELKELRAYL